MDLIAQKQCTKCKSIKPIGCYSPRRGSRSGFASNCSACRAEQARARKARNKARQFVHVPAQKKCWRCGDIRPSSDFNVNRAARDGLCDLCKPCMRAASAERYERNRERYLERNRRWKEENPERLRDAQRRYSLRVNVHPDATPELKRDLLAYQGGVCAICRTNRPTGRGDFHLDHDHATGVIRGVLCNRCNTGLGLFRDDPRLLAAAIAYIERFRPSEAPVAPVLSAQPAAV